MKITPNSCNQVSNAITGIGPKVSKEVYKAHVPMFVSKTGEIRDGVLACGLMLKIYKNQTPAERSAGRTVKSNGKGFNRIDARLLTPRVRRIIARGLQSLRAADFALITARIPKYLGQVA